MARKFTFTPRVTRRTREVIKREIVQAIESSPEFKREIARVFQVANRRIQNVEKSGAFSPAVASLGDRGSNFSKFSIGGKTWQQLKMEYGRAVAFLQQPTSTASGARQYNQQIKARYNLTDQEFNALANEYGNKITSLSGTDYVDKYLKRYKDFSGEYEQAIASSSTQMESEAVRLGEALEQQLVDDLTFIADDFDGLDIPF